MSYELKIILLALILSWIPVQQYRLRSGRGAGLDGLNSAMGRGGTSKAHRAPAPGEQCGWCGRRYWLCGWGIHSTAGCSGPWAIRALEVLQRLWALPGLPTPRPMQTLQPLLATGLHRCRSCRATGFEFVSVYLQLLLIFGGTESVFTQDGWGWSRALVCWPVAYRFITGAAIAGCCFSYRPRR